VIDILSKIPLERRNIVMEVTVDMAGRMNFITKKRRQIVCQKIENQ
jgi:hypothetical protein